MFYGVLDRQKREIQDLKQALAISRLMTEQYRQLLVGAYGQIGLLNFSLKDLRQKINSCGYNKNCSFNEDSDE